MTQASGLRVWLACIVGALVLGLACWHFWPATRPLPPAERAWLLIGEVRVPDPALAGPMRDLLATGFEQSGVVRTLSRGQVRAALGAAGLPSDTVLTHDIAVQVAYRSNVRAIVEANVIQLGRQYVVTLSLVDVPSGQARMTVARRARKADDLIPVVGALVERVRSKLGEDPSALRTARPLPLLRTNSMEALEHYAHALEIAAGDDAAGAVAEFQQAVLLDEGFAAAWAARAVFFGNMGERDSAASCVSHALAIEGRALPAQRAYWAGLLAMYRDGDAAAVPKLREAVQLGWGDATQALAAALMGVGRYDEALVYWRQFDDFRRSLRLPLYRVNEWMLLVNMGRLAESDSLVPEVSRRYPVVRAYQALCSERWAVAESLARLDLITRGPDSGHELETRRVLSAVLAARGDLRGARRVLLPMWESRDGSIERPLEVAGLWTLYNLLDGVRARAPWDTLRRPEREEWATYAIVRDAVADDRAAVRADRDVPGLRRDTSWDLQARTLADGILALNEHRYWEARASLRAMASTGFAGRELAYGDALHMSRWVVASAFEAEGQLDSARVWFELVLEPGRTQYQSWVAHAATLPFALQHLVIINARLGRYADAESRLQELKALLTNADARMSMLLAEATTSVRNAESQEARRLRRLANAAKKHVAIGFPADTPVPPPVGLRAHRV